MLAGAALTGALAAPGCVAAAAVVTTAYAVEMISESGYTLTVKAEAPPRELYNKLVATLKARNPNIEVLEENQAERKFRAKATDSEGTRKWVSFVVGPLPDETSQLLIAAGYDGKEGRKIRDWMLEQIDEVFDEMGIEWKIAAAEGEGAATIG
jgi:hypothetical protein